MIRPVRPTDLVGLAALQRRGYPNEAYGRRALGRERDDWTDLFRVLNPLVSFEIRRHTLLFDDGDRLTGLVSTLPFGRGYWEIDRLIWSPDGRPQDCAELLRRLGLDAAEHGVERIYLRLASDSPVLGAARAAGFVPYRTETLFRGGPVRLAAEGTGRPRRRGDDLPLFRLYCRVVPLTVRQAEAMTLTEWRQWFRGGRQLVVEEAGEPVLWARLGTVDDQVQLTAEASDLPVPALTRHLGAFLARHGGKKAVIGLVADYQPHVAAALEQLGLEPAGRFISLVRHQTVRVEAKKLVPVRA
jgi:hypothetical protein